jgi:hypothetical protein
MVGVLVSWRTLDDLHAERAEIDENLIRCNLTPAQEAAAVFRCKFIYEKLHPETTAEANASNARKTSDNLSFVPATSEATGTNRRTVERAAARGEALGDDLNDIAGTSLDKGVELGALAKMDAPALGVLRVLNVEMQRYRFRRPRGCPLPAGIRWQERQPAPARRGHRQQIRERRRRMSRV